MNTQVRKRRRRALDAASSRVFRLPVGRQDYSLTRAVPVPMRDGHKLLTDIYAPCGESLGTLLVRTPYGRVGPIAFLTSRFYATHGYQVVNQSCRGTGGSGGVFDPFRQEIYDGADTLDWLRTQSWFGGRLALCGPSYLGYCAWAMMMDPPPELAAAVIAVTACDNHWVAHGAGAFSLEQILGLMDGFGELDDGLARSIMRGVTGGRRLKRGHEELPLVRAQNTVFADSRMPYREWLTAPNVDDSLWQPLRLGQALERINVPVLLQSAWQDRFPDHMIEQYERLRRRGVNVGLTIGPWTHFEMITKGAGLVAADTLDWLAEHLAGTGRSHRPTPVHIFVTGADEWRHLPHWPPETTEYVLYLRTDGELDENQPGPASTPSRFTYDPAKPTPTVGGRVINPAIGGYRDNRKLEARVDVLTFTSPRLSEPLEVIGNPVVELIHYTDNPHADLFVRLCEVRENGRSINISDGFERLDPSQSSGSIRLRLEAVAHRFNPGTRLRLQISGGAHPRYARNLGTDEDFATSTRLAPSIRTICHGTGGISRLCLPAPATSPPSPSPTPDRA